MKPEHPAEDFDVENVLEALEMDRRSGILSNIVTRSAIRYGVAPDEPDRLMAVDTYGKKQDI
jgi:hypothetical protein